MANSIFCGKRLCGKRFCGKRFPTRHVLAPIALALLLVSPLLAQKSNVGVPDQWQTDKQTAEVPLAEFRAFVPRDAFLPFAPKAFWNQRQAQASQRYDPKEPLVVIEVRNTQKAYPLQLLSHHGVISDFIGGQPIALTYCPFSGLVKAYIRRFVHKGRQYQPDFAWSGMLRNGNTVLWDSQTESWWQQATGRALVGPLAGVKLSFLPITILNKEQFYTIYPYGLLLSHTTEQKDWYYHNPYFQYDHPENDKPELLAGMPRGPLRPTERTLLLQTPRGALVFPFKKLQAQKVINHEFLGDYVAVFYWEGSRSLLDTHDVRQGKEAGHAAAFSALLDGRHLHFSEKDGKILDIETASTWNLLGLATDGPLAGAQLSRLPNSHVMFAFTAFAFNSALSASDVYE